MIGDREVLRTCLNMDETVFYVPAHRIIFQALRHYDATVYDRQPVDFKRLKDYLQVAKTGASNQLEEIGEKQYLSEVFGLIESPCHWRMYLHIVQDSKRRRDLIDKDELRDPPKQILASFRMKKKEEFPELEDLPYSRLAKSMIMDNRNRLHYASITP